MTRENVKRIEIREDTLASKEMILMLTNAK